MSFQAHVPSAWPFKRESFLKDGTRRDHDNLKDARVHSRLISPSLASQTLLFCFEASALQQLLAKPHNSSPTLAFVVLCLCVTQHKERRHPARAGLSLFKGLPVNGVPFSTIIDSDVEY